MRFTTRIPPLAAALCLAYGGSAAAAGDTDIESRLKALEQQMRSLSAQNNELKSKLATAEKRLEESGERLDKVATSSEQTSANHFGGYGELHYNRLENKLTGGADKNEIDFHRFVLFYGHDFSSRTRFRSELEVEHGVAAPGDPGEVGLEQAYIEHDISDRLTAKVGLFLTPVGILNETHEPPSFYGVERNPVETNIIPSTWREAGVNLTTRLDNGVSFDVAAHSGLAVAASSTYAVRNGRTNAAEAPAKNPAVTARIKWAGIPGLELAAAYQRQGNIAQGADPNVGAGSLLETHATLNRGPFGLKALWARWTLDGSGPKAVGADRQEGFYLEPSFKLSEQWGVFARYNRWDNKAGDSADSRNQQTNVGVNYWLDPHVVVKLDVQQQRVPAGNRRLDGLNLGIGYQF